MVKLARIPPGVDLATDPIVYVPTSDPNWRDEWGKFADAQVRQVATLRSLF
jgi:hypothetical protein